MAYAYAKNEKILEENPTIEVKTRSGESLWTQFTCDLGDVVTIEMSGPAQKVFQGIYTID